MKPNCNIWTIKTFLKFIWQTHSSCTNSSSFTTQEAHYPVKWCFIILSSEICNSITHIKLCSPYMKPYSTYAFWSRFTAVWTQVTALSAGTKMCPQQNRQNSLLCHLNYEHSLFWCAYAHALCKIMLQKLWNKCHDF